MCKLKKYSHSRRYGIGFLRSSVRSSSDAMFRVRFGETSAHVLSSRNSIQESFVDMRPVFGLIFLFKYTDKSATTTGKVVANPDIFFAKQVINNACATQAILAVLMNVQNPDVNLGKFRRNTVQAHRRRPVVFQPSAAPQFVEAAFFSRRKSGSVEGIHERIRPPNERLDVLQL